MQVHEARLRLRLEAALRDHCKQRTKATINDGTGHGFKVGDVVTISDRLEGTRVFKISKVSSTEIEGPCLT